MEPRNEHEIKINIYNGRTNKFYTKKFSHLEFLFRFI
jgi:hypothetical protein